MTIILLILAIGFLVVGHLFKVYRWQQFIEIYEKPKTNNLMQALSLGYIINFIIPFRIGDLFRAWYAGRKMKNGISFSLATVIVDRVLDILCVAIFFGIFYLVGFQDYQIKDSALFYIIGGITLILLIFLAFKFSKFIKILTKKIASIFNSNIELKILKVSWFGINAFKDIALKLKKKALILNTILMWGGYLTSYTLFSLVLDRLGYNFNFLDIFVSLFSKSTIDISMASVLSDFSNSLSLVMVGYITAPLIILLLISFIPKFNLLKKDKKQSEKHYLELLPHINIQDKLVFLEAYFSGESRNYFKNYLKLNQDISIIQDYSAGSNATTLLCVKNDRTFFRKYAIGKDNDKLYEQILWLKNHQKDLPLTEIIDIKKGKDYCCYDMPYNNRALSCFNYIHSTPIEKGWKVVKTALDDINKYLHTKNIRSADDDTINEYIDKKITKNLEKIENGVYIKPLLKYDNIFINGKKYYNLSHFKKYLSSDYLYNVFKEDQYSDIHGDLTIENIICLNDSEKYYIIDPNTGNLHDSPFLDYSKLLQSLHGGYEFYMNTKSIEIIDNNLNYLFTKSVVYDVIFKKYHEYLESKFSYAEVKSIFFHEIVHWLRLMPYKIEKNGQRAVLFYAGLIIVLNEIIEMYGD